MALYLELHGFRSILWKCLAIPSIHKSQKDFFLSISLLLSISHPLPFGEWVLFTNFFMTILSHWVAVIFHTLFFLLFFYTHHHKQQFVCFVACLHWFSTLLCKWWKFQIGKNLFFFLVVWSKSVWNGTEMFYIHLSLECVCFCRYFRILNFVHHHHQFAEARGWIKYVREIWNDDDLLYRKIDSCFFLSLLCFSSSLFVVLFLSSS